MCVCACVSKRGGEFRVEKLLLAKGKDKRRGVEVVVGHNGLSQAISERSGAVFSGAVRSAKLALISPVVGDV